VLFILEFHWNDLLINFHDVILNKKMMQYVVIRQEQNSSSTYNIRGVSKSSRTGHLEPELQMVQLSAIRCSCIAILWVTLVSFVAITLRVASQRVFIVVYLVMTQSGNFWIHPHIAQISYSYFNRENEWKIFFAFWEIQRWISQEEGRWDIVCINNKARKIETGVEMQVNGRSHI
jgi:hypothetical protein